MQPHEGPIPGAMFVQQQEPEAPEEERGFGTGNVGVSPELAQATSHSQSQESERSQRQRRGEPDFGEEQDARDREPADHEHDGDREAIDAFVQVQKHCGTLHCRVSVGYSDSLKTVELISTQPAATSLILVNESGEAPVAASSMHVRKYSAPNSGRP